MSVMIEQATSPLGLARLDPDPWRPPGRPPRVGILLNGRNQVAWYDDIADLDALETAAREARALLLRAQEEDRQAAQAVMQTAMDGPAATPDVPVPPPAEPATNLFDELGGDEPATAPVAMIRPYVPQHQAPAAPPAPPEPVTPPFPVGRPPY
ncbi:hypothetical protein Aph01nite_81390 [Acrocarpospora phusangensis]|uniref:Uncharacterized protein n=1 Tax=Acrocarpospora phusangensis TaxID=1070424 RepID=A0A919QKI0_9ACTN|nr:hypothetical protein [Acrocarpospora phusangensis]GIH29829.1 hypothetical protein Aph01nite_81390 [Acrocarpospora phusangensis]